MQGHRFLFVLLPGLSRSLHARGLQLVDVDFGTLLTLPLYGLGVLVAHRDVGFVEDGQHFAVDLLKCKNSDGAEIFRVFSKVVMFTSIDDAWREHLREMDDLRQSVQNATYEQKDPLLIYKFESFGLFSKMIVKVNRDVLAILNKAYIPVRDQNAEAVQRERQERAKVDVNKLQASRMQAAAQAGQQDKQKPMPVHVEKKVGRNDPCPCGSGKKYKQCHGKGI